MAVTDVSTTRAVLIFIVKEILIVTSVDGIYVSGY